METGVTGELVYTSLQRECVPLLRFRTRDRIEVLGTSCVCGRTGFRLRCIGRTDDMLIVLGVNVFPSAVRDVVAAFYPSTTGEIQILLEQPGPRVDPPLQVVAESAVGSAAWGELKSQIEGKLRDVLTIAANVELVPAGTLPRYEMKGQLVKHLDQNRVLDAAGRRRKVLV